MCKWVWKCVSASEHTRSPVKSNRKILYLDQNAINIIHSLPKKGLHLPITHSSTYNSTNKKIFLFISFFVLLSSFVGDCYYDYLTKPCKVVMIVRLFISVVFVSCADYCQQNTCVATEQYKYTYKWAMTGTRSFQKKKTYTCALNTNATQTQQKQLQLNNDGKMAKSV